MPVISRLTDHGVEVFDAVPQLLYTVPVPPPAHYRQPGTEAHAVTSTMDRVAYVTDSAVVLVRPDGTEVWRLDLGARRHDGNGCASCAFAAGDRLLWVYLPNEMAGRDGGDQWLVIDAADGEVRRRHPLPSVGEGGHHHALSDGRMLLDIGEGQDGTRIFLAEPDGEVREFPWSDRSVVDVSPDELQFMTVHHDQEDVRFHAFPGGKVEARLKIAALEKALGLQELFFEWTGGYLDGDTAVVVLSGEDSREGEWWRHFRVSTSTGEVLGELPIVTIDAYDLRPMGDGTYVITDTDGTLRRM